MIATGVIGIGASALALHSPDPQLGSTPLFQGVQMDPRYLRIFERSCQDCHSQQTRWPWYSRIPPASWIIEQDVREARAHLDLSSWQNHSADQQRELLAAIGAAVRAGAMPPKRYLLMHSDAGLRPEERREIYGWTRAQRSGGRR